MPSTFEIVVAIAGFGMWIFFPIGLFLSVAHLDTHTDQKQHSAPHQQTSSAVEQAKNVAEEAKRAA